jgi:flagellar FliL protein
MATTDAAPATGGSRKKRLILIVVGVLVLLGGAGGTTMWLLGGKEAKSASAKAKKDKAADEESADEADSAANDGEAAADGEAEDPEAADAESGDEEGKPKAAAIYVELVPAFVVNFQDDKKRARFLKAEISILVKNAESEEALKANRPAIRNSLVMLLSRQVYDQLMTPEGKEKLRADALVEVRAIVTKVAGPKPAKQIQDVFFSSLVMQ